MRWIVGRPAGVAILVLSVTLNGLGSLAEAVELGISDGRNLPATLVALVIGLALLHRAHGLWTFCHRAWLATAVILALRALASAVEILIGSAVLTTWVALILSIVVVLYLLDPRTRVLFSSGIWS